MRAPGALHHARFMASSLYILKMVMLANDLPQGLATPEMMTSLTRMAQYIALFHGPWYLQANMAVLAPRLDLHLWDNMALYEVYLKINLDINLFIQLLDRPHIFICIMIIYIFILFCRKLMLP